VTETFPEFLPDNEVPTSGPDTQFRVVRALERKAQRLEGELARLKASERTLSDFVENALECLHKVGPDGTILWANQAELDLLGYEADEYIGRHVSDFHTDREGIDRILKRVTAGEKLYNQPAILRCKDGSLRHVLIHSNACFEAGEFRYSRCFTRDVTELQQAERERALLASIIESSGDAIVSKTSEGIIRSWNRGAERLFGFTQAEAVGQPITLIIPSDRHAEETEILARLRRGERIEHYETIRIARDGRRIDISLTVSPLFDSAGNFIGAAKIARDITERKLAQHQLRESEARFRGLIEMLPVGVYACEAPSGTVTFYNDQAARLWGRAPTKGDTDQRFCGAFKLYSTDGTFMPHERSPMAAALREGRRFRNQEVTIERPDGSRITALVNIDPITDAGGNVVAAVNTFLDMTALKRAQQQLKDAGRRKDEFLATLAHELRNPLAPLSNGLHILRMYGHDGIEAVQVLEMMERQVAHMVRLVDDLLELSRISRGKIALKREPIAVATVIGNALETSRPVIEAEGHSLHLALPEEDVLVKGDLIRLSQVFSNLLNNAAKYTEKGGRISVAATRAGAEVHIAVRDTGIGIPGEMLPRVFDMFSQIDHPLRPGQQGLGIGLNLVRSLVGMHGGTVEARSEGPGHGSEFIVRLPILQARSTGVNGDLAAVDNNVAPRSVRRILCVDDNRDVADSLAKMLGLLDADVETAYDGPSALDAMKRFRPSIVLMDLGMPGMDGGEVARRIRQDPAYDNVLLIAITGWGQADDRQRSRDAGFDHHLVKPVDMSALQTLLGSDPHKLLRTGQFRG
jgi:PAS domain S-box-containing protein